MSKLSIMGLQSETNAKFAALESMLSLIVERLPQGNQQSGNGNGQQPPVVTLPVNPDADDQLLADQAHDDGMAAPELPRHAPASDISLRRRKSGSAMAGGEVHAGNIVSRSGIGSLPNMDDSWRKIPMKIKVKDELTGNEIEKTKPMRLNLQDHTRQTIKAIALSSYPTAADGVGVSKPKQIRIAQVDENGKAVQGTINTLILTESQTGSLMLTGDVSVRMDLEDETGKGQLIFAPFSRGQVYLVGNHWIRQAVRKS